MIHKSQLPTPALLVDLEVLKYNIAYMARKTSQIGVNLRPHIKTHKSTKIAQMQIAAGAIGITCAKISEAEVMAQTGVDDIFVAYPIVGDYQLGKAAALARCCRLTLACDSLVAAQRMNYYAGTQGLKFRLSLIINTGGNRDGILPEQAVSLAEEIRHLPNLELRGVMTHEGHLHKCRDMVEVDQQANEAAIKLVSVAEELREAGFVIDTVSTGSSLASYSNTRIPGITEWRPGTYVFNDVMQQTYTDEAMCALTVKATVVSHPSENRYLLDAGSKVLSEASHPLFKHGIIKSAPEATLVQVNEEHGIVSAPRDTFDIGQQIEIIPVHVCTAVNLANSFYVVNGDRVVDRWTVDARGLVL